MRVALLSRQRRSTEEYVSEDWPAVARAINSRMAELEISQRELIARSSLSKAIVREIQHNIVQRRRGARTLEALSTALEWHPDHLSSVLADRTPPRLGEPRVRSDDDIVGRLTAIEYQLQELSERVSGIAGMSQQLDDIGAAVEKVLDQVSGSPDDQR
jgi:hypothetical protein